MGRPGKIAFPVILVIGAITGFITYISFTAAIPEEGRIDSPYFQPLSPGSGGNEAGNSGGGAAQQGGGGAAQQGGGGAAQQGGGGAAQQGGGGAASNGASTTTITILQGSAVQGSPDYDPDSAQVPLSNKVIWHNADTVPHTATSGSGAQDPQSGQVFDTSIINGGEDSPAVELKGATEGQTIPYHCMIHPYMTAEIKVAAAAAGGGAAAANQTGGATTGAAGGGGPTITILEGSAVQGNPDYDPDQLTASAGAEITVANQDTVPHTATSGTGPQDPQSGQLFDTSIINPSETATISLAQAAPGQYDYHCMIHPYMTGKITVQ
jgi:plastocyanin